MPGVQALDGQRANAFTFAPGELTLIVDPKHPLYDPRVCLPVDRAFVVDIAARGVLEPIGARRVGDASVVLFGKQRTKAVAVANALGAGVSYDGDVQSVIDAIGAWIGDADFRAQLATLMGGKPLRVPAIARNGGDDAAARLMMRAENAHRRGDPVLERIRSAQLAVEKHGDSPEDIAQAENVDVKTVKRWLAMDVSNGRKKPKRGFAEGPGKVALRKFHAHPDIDDGYKILFGWLTGQNTREEMLHMHPHLKGVV